MKANGHKIPLKRRASARQSRGAAQLSEFGAGLSILVFSMIIPVVLCLRVALALAVGQLATERAAFAAATAATYDQALRKSEQQLQMTTRSPIGATSGLVPCGGFEKKGVDLYILIQGARSLAAKENHPDHAGRLFGEMAVLKQKEAGAQAQAPAETLAPTQTKAPVQMAVVGPNLPLAREIIDDNEQYFYSVVTHFTVAALPGCSNSSFVLNLSARRRCENPQSMRIQAAEYKSLVLPQRRMGANNAG